MSEHLTTEKTLTQQLAHRLTQIHLDPISTWERAELVAATIELLIDQKINEFRKELYAAMAQKSTSDNP